MGMCSLPIGKAFPQGGQGRPLLQLQRERSFAKKGKVFVNKAERLKETQRLLDEMVLDYNPREKMGNLNVAQRQMIEILKSLSRERSLKRLYRRYRYD